MQYKVVVSRRVVKQLRSMPGHIVDKLATWIEAVETDGLSMVKKASGYHDEPLKGQRKGQRSLRLSHCYRAIYATRVEEATLVVTLLEVNKHAY